MAKKDINGKPFADATQLKLDIFRRCFREWFPVFVHNPTIKHVFIYDLFAGSGYDSVGNPGSPIILLEEAMGDKKQHCVALSQKSKLVAFAFNEMESAKRNQLENAITSKISGCKATCSMPKRVYESHIYYADEDFTSLIERPNLNSILANPAYAKFVLLDQYGFSKVNEGIFLKLVQSPTTDFIFFISSSFIRRFKNEDAVKHYIDTQKIDFNESLPKESHRVIADFFRSLIPADKEFYIHHFTIKRGSNYYGLIFGSGHTLGMEKFIKVCWAEDPKSGESNCNIDNDFEEGSLFYNLEQTEKKQRVRQELRNAILNGTIKNNIDGLKKSLSLGCEPKLFIEVINDLKKEKKVSIMGVFNKRSTNIHKIEEYQIKLL